MSPADGQLTPPSSASATAPLEASGLFARNATGLVREVSGKQQIFFNFLNGFPPQILAISVFVALAGFPGGNPFVACLLAIPISVCISYTFGLLTAVMPRTGGDYVFVSRTLGPVLGLLSSSAYLVGGGIVSIAYWAEGTVTLALAPALSTVGVVANSPTLVRWANTLSTNHNWQFGIGVVFILIGCLICLRGWRLVRRVIFTIMWVVLAGLGFTVIVAIFTSPASFVSHFNAFAAGHGVHDGYHAVIATAEKKGVTLNAGFSWAKTIPMLGAFATFGLYSWFSALIGGEIRQGGTVKAAHRMALGAFFALGTVALCIALFLHTFGHNFLAAANAGGLPSNLGLLPSYFYLTSVQLNSTVVAVILCLAFIGTFPINISFMTLFVTRYLFAWGFDGLLPDRVTHVNDRGAPDVAVLWTTVAAVLAYVWAIYIAKNFVQALVYVALLTFITIGLVAVAGIVLPYRRPAAFRASGANIRLLGVPVVVLTGIVSIIAIGVITYLYFHFPYFGLADKTGLWYWVGGVIVLACALYLVPRELKRRKGEDLSLVFGEIPPE